MRSTLGQMFLYAKAIKHEALENFLTEALAGAIRHEPGPFLDLLAARVLIPQDVSAAPISVTTQLSVGGVGIFDLVLSCEDPRWSVWIEVKAEAGETGDQLKRYQEYLDGQPGYHLLLLGPKNLLLLGPESLRKKAKWLSWQEVWNAIAPKSTTSPYWRDLRTFLQERNMADDHNEPLRAREVATMEHARSLLLKVRRILKLVAEYANQQWPGSDWPESDDDLQKILSQQFWSHNQLSIYNRRHHHCGVKIGVGHHAEYDYEGVWIFANPSPR